MTGVRRLGLALAALVIAALVVGLVGGFIPQLLGPPTNPVVAVLLGYAVFRDILRRDEARGTRRVREASR
jgi:hypothetical protein